MEKAIKIILTILKILKDICLTVLKTLGNVCVWILKILKKLYYQIPQSKRYVVVLCGLVFFAFAGTVFCVHVDNVREKAAQEKAAQEEALRIEREKAVEEKRRAEAEEKRRKSDSLQPGVEVGTFEQGEEKIVYLTFDDGPSENTGKVLEILEQYDAKATFFVIGPSEDCKHYIKDAYEAGHTIGMHTYSHEYDEIYASTEAFWKDLEKIEEVVEEQIGFVPCYTRFPGGASNTISARYSSGIMTKLTKEVNEKGYQYYDWNWDSGDGGNPTTEEVYQNAIGCEDNEIILLFHDSAAKMNTVEALPRILEHYKERGYVFKGISRDSYVSHHSVNN